MSTPVVTGIVDKSSEIPWNQTRVPTELKTQLDTTLQEMESGRFDSYDALLKDPKWGNSKWVESLREVATARGVRTEAMNPDETSRRDSLRESERKWELIHNNPLARINRTTSRALGGKPEVKINPFTRELQLDQRREQEANKTFMEKEQQELEARTKYWEERHAKEAAERAARGEADQPEVRTSPWGRREGEVLPGGGVVTYNEYSNTWDIRYPDLPPVAPPIQSEHVAPQRSGGLMELLGLKDEPEGPKADWELNYKNPFDGWFRDEPQPTSTEIPQWEREYKNPFDDFFKPDEPSTSTWEYKDPFEGLFGDSKETDEVSTEISEWEKNYKDPFSNLFGDDETETTTESGWEWKDPFKGLFSDEPGQQTEDTTGKVGGESSVAESEPKGKGREDTKHWWNTPNQRVEEYEPEIRDDEQTSPKQEPTQKTKPTLKFPWQRSTEPKNTPSNPRETTEPGYDVGEGTGNAPGDNSQTGKPVESDFGPEILPRGSDEGEYGWRMPNPVDGPGPIAPEEEPKSAAELTPQDFTNAYYQLSDKMENSEYGYDSLSPTEQAAYDALLSYGPDGISSDQYSDIATYIQSDNATSAGDQVEAAPAVEDPSSAPAV